MSRSRKKFPCIKHGYPHNQFYKRWANKRIRRNGAFCSNWGAFKKQFEQWEIYECRWIMSKKEVDRRGWEDKKNYISK